MKKLLLLGLACSLNAIISDAQNVGVGTTTPSEKLDVQGNIKASDTAKLKRVAVGNNFSAQYPLSVNYNGKGLAQVSENGLVSAGFYVTNSNAFIQTNTNHPLNFTTNDGNTQMSLGTNGNLSIGSTTPSNYKLNVTGSTKLDGASLLTGATIVDNMLTVNGNTDINGNSQTTGNAGVVGNLTVNGKIGIGTSNSPYKLDVAGSTKLNGASLITGATVIDNTLTVNNNTEINGTAQISGATTLNNNLAVNGNTILGGSVIIGGNYAIIDDVTIDGGLTLANGNQGTGKVLTSDANGNANWQVPTPSGNSGAFFAALENTWNIPYSSTGNYSMVPFKTTASGAGLISPGFSNSNYNNLFNIFYAPESGFYHFNVRMKFDIYGGTFGTIPDYNINSRIKINNNGVIKYIYLDPVIIRNGDPNPRVTEGSIDIKLPESTTVSVEVLMTFNGLFQLIADDNNRFTGYKIN